MKQLGFENHQQLIGSLLSDREAARKREISIRDKTPRNLAYILIGGSMAIGGLLLFGELKLIAPWLGWCWAIYSTNPGRHRPIILASVGRRVNSGKRSKYTE